MNQTQCDTDSDVKNSTGRVALGASRAKSTPRLPAAFGVRRDQMPDHLYSLPGGRHIYTSPWVKETSLKRCDAIIGITATSQPFKITVAKRTSMLSAGALQPMVQRIFEADNVGIIGFHFYPSHPLFPRFRRISAPGLLPLNRKIFDVFNEQLHAAYQGALTAAQASELFDAVAETAMKVFPRAKPIDKRVAQTIELLWERYDYPLSELAAKVGLSSFRLSHLFAENMGITLRSYLQWRKIRKAISLAKNKDMSLAQIAVASGFTDAAHFSKAFLQLHAAPPSYFLNGGNVKIISPESGS